MWGTGTLTGTMTVREKVDRWGIWSTPEAGSSGQACACSERGRVKAQAQQPEQGVCTLSHFPGWCSFRCSYPWRCSRYVPQLGSSALLGLQPACRVCTRTVAPMVTNPVTTSLSTVPVTVQHRLMQLTTFTFLERCVSIRGDFCPLGVTG